MLNNQELNTIKQRLQEYMQAKLPRAKRGGFVCPNCQNGSGKDGTGIDVKKGNKTYWKCFKCDSGGDIFVLSEIIIKSSNFIEQVKNVCSTLNIPFESICDNETLTKYSNSEKKNFDLWNENLSKTDYLTKRGITDSYLLDKFNIGYCESWTHPDHPNTPKTKRIIIPTSNYSYLARDIENNGDFSKQKVGASNIFNLYTLFNSKKPIVVVEGEIDALSIMEAGGEAIGLGSTSNVDAFIEYATKRDLQKGKEIILILSLDADKSGKEAQRKLKDFLTEYNEAQKKKYVRETKDLEINAPQISFYEYSLCGGYKDPNEFLVSNRNAFIDECQRLKDKLSIERAIFENSTNANLLFNKFTNAIENNKNEPIRTGFNNIDNLLGGGLYTGLYTLGAISNLGKTSFCLQMCDNVAKAGTPVLFFSLEQSTFTLMAKSIARLTYELSGELAGIASETIEILQGRNYPTYERDKTNLIMKATGEYQTRIAKNINIINKIVSAKDIRNYVEKYLSFYPNARPLVIVDYLQILGRYPKTTEFKESLDKSIAELANLANEKDLPLIAICSLNRESYNKNAQMNAYKGSGDIEYGADVGIILRYDEDSEDMGDITEKINELKRKGEPLNISFNVVKNRLGRTGNAPLELASNFGYFKDAPKKEINKYIQSILDKQKRKH